MGKMKVDAHAKVNWDLHVLGKRPDGFHEVDTVMVSVGLADELTFEPSERLSLTCSDPALPCDDSNLVVKAARALARAAGVEPRARIHVEKRIPMGGGLGGGSSDAAATLQALNRLWALDWPVERLAGVAAELGSDVAFFLWGGWCRCKGRGEIVEPLVDLNRLPSVPMWLIIPPYNVSTPAVYKSLGAGCWNGTPEHRTLTELEEAVKVEVSGLVNHKECKPRPVNDLLAAAQSAEPRLEGFARHLEEQFPGRWRMSGSGAVHFVFPNPEMELEHAQHRLNSFPDSIRIVVTVTRSA
jgi:4-diphosphocytidyl-2-C-methyl-D-erythritol kinase